MKLIAFILLINFTSSYEYKSLEIIDNSEYFLSYSETKLHKLSDRKAEKDLLISIILHSKWVDYSSIVKMTANELRNLLITQLNIRTSETIKT